MTDAGDEPLREIRIDAVDPATMALWRTVAKVAQALDDERRRWSLVGGLMVALYAIESGQVVRPPASTARRASASRSTATSSTSSRPMASNARR